MTFYDAYIGSLEDPKFSWSGGDWQGDIPEPIGPLFPPTQRSRGYSSNAFGEILARINEGAFEGKQVDWGAWVAKADKEQLRSFVDDLYPARQTKALRRFIDGLDDDKYAFVASEL